MGFGRRLGRAALLLAALAVCGVHAKVDGACKGGEQAEYKGQPVAKKVSAGKCMADGKTKCEDTYSKSSNGATGCEEDPASVLCCSKTICQDGGQVMKKKISKRADQGGPHEANKEGDKLEDQEGVCRSMDKCKEMGWISTSDSIYSGSATGCRHLPDEIMCCSPPWANTCEDVGGESEQQTDEATPCDEPAGGDGVWTGVDKDIGESYQKLMCRCPSDCDVKFLKKVVTSIAGADEQKKMVEKLIKHSAEMLARIKGKKKDCKLPAPGPAPAPPPEDAPAPGSGGKWWLQKPPWWLPPPPEWTKEQNQKQAEWMEKLQDAQAAYQLKLTKAQGEWVQKLHEAQELWKKKVNEAGSKVTGELKTINGKLKDKYKQHKDEVREFYVKWYHDANKAHLAARDEHQKKWDDIYDKEKAYQDDVHPGCVTRMWNNVHLPSGESKWVPICMQGAVIPKIKFSNPTYKAPWEQSPVPSLKEIRDFREKGAHAAMLPHMWSQLAPANPQGLSGFAPMYGSPPPTGGALMATAIPAINANGQAAVAPVGMTPMGR